MLDLCCCCCSFGSILKKQKFFSYYSTYVSTSSQTGTPCWLQQVQQHVNPEGVHSPSSSLFLTLKAPSHAARRPRYRCSRTGPSLELCTSKRPPLPFGPAAEPGPRRSLRHSEPWGRPSWNTGLFCCCDGGRGGGTGYRPCFGLEKGLEIGVMLVGATYERGELEREVLATCEKQSILLYVRVPPLAPLASGRKFAGRWYKWYAVGKTRRKKSGRLLRSNYHIYMRSICDLSAIYLCDLLYDELYGDLPQICAFLLAERTVYWQCW